MGYSLPILEHILDPQLQHDSKHIYPPQQSEKYLEAKCHQKTRGPELIMQSAKK